MNILGVSAPLSWNPAAAIVKDGKFLACAEEERFIRIKHAPHMLPLKSIEFCLDFARVQPHEVDAIGFGYRWPLDSYLRSSLENIKQGDFVRAIREGGAHAEYLIGLIRLTEWLEKKGLRLRGNNKVLIKFYPHHQAHAASAFRCSGLNSSNIITIDGQGEDDAGSLWYGRDGAMNKFKKIGHHQSLGTVYDHVTEVIGFKPHSHEGKVMGLAAYGNRELPYKDLWQTKKTSYKLHRGWSERFYERFGPMRKSRDPITQRHKNIAHTVQKFTERAGTALATKAYETYQSNNICLAGGVALNCDMNAQIWKLPFVKKIFVQPASNDAGTAIGAALELAYELGESADFEMKHAYWGPEYADTIIEHVLKESKIEYRKIKNIEQYTAKQLAEGKIVGWFQGRSEIGPRALGNRSILAHPGLKGMKDKINKEVKHRESWRPFAPSILHEYGDEYFENYCYHPFMVLALKAKSKAYKPLSEALHIDKTGRIQSVTKENNLRYYTLIDEFRKLTGVPALLNTSFNDSEEPLIETPKDALKTFYGTGLDMLVIGNYVVEKTRVTQSLNRG